MNTNHVICIGFAKSGTTLLNQVLGETKEFVTPFTKKELGFFLPKNFTNDLNIYLSNYQNPEEAKREGKIFFESSPPYSHTSWSLFKEIVSNIKRLLYNPKIIICLRHPLYRSFSHYIHNINVHFSYNGFSYNRDGDVFEKSFCIVGV